MIPATLVLFTTHFPFGKFETYLEHELEHLARVFDRVIIQPMSANGTARAVPANVIVERPLWGQTTPRWLFFLRELLTLSYWRGVLTSLAEATSIHRRADFWVAIRICLWETYRNALLKRPLIGQVAASPSAYVAYSYWANTPALALPILARHGVPTVVRYHRVDLYEYGMQNATWIHRHAQFFPWRHRLAETSSLSLFVSEHGKDYFLAHWGKHSFARCEIARLGTRDHGINPSSSSPDKLVIVSCSHIAPVKRVHLIAKLVCELAKHRNVDWHHFGAGECSTLEQQLAICPPNLHVRMWGHVSNRDILSFYGNTHVDLFVNLSESEGVPVSIMEAISFGIPVLATAVDGNPEVVIEGRSGMLCGPHEAAESHTLAQRVLEGFASASGFFSLDPRRVWSERFNADVNYSDLSEKIRALVTQSA